MKYLDESKNFIVVVLYQRKMDYINVITAHTLIRANRIASTPIPKNNKLRKWLPPPVISFKVSVTSAGFFGL